jgi:FkbM family methyltransferase
MSHILRVIFAVRVIILFVFWLSQRPKNNIDYIRFGVEHKPAELNLKRTITSILSYVKNKRFFQVYSLFEDNYSKKLFINLLIFKTLGSKHVKLPLNNEKFWTDYTSIDQNYKNIENSDTVGRFSLNHYSVPFANTNINLIAHPLSILNTFLLQQYQYNRNGLKIGVEPGDIIIDGGACWGDTALYFAKEAGKNGAVYSFEFGKENLRVFEKNLSLNSILGKNIFLKKLAIWDKSGEIIEFDEGGPGTSLFREASVNSAKVTTTTIDDFVKNDSLLSVDFIKMDIEGAESAAITGAKESIIKFKPKLAISVYHSMKDFCYIPLMLANISNEYSLGYKFYLDHFTLYDEETVLFCISDK